LAVALISLGTALPVSAQAGLNFQAGGGFTTPFYNTGRTLDTGWNVGGGVGVSPIPYWGMNLDVLYNQMSINRSTLTAIQVPDGNVKVWSATINPILRVNPRERAGMYITGGGGFYQRRVQFTQPTTITGSVFDPFFGIFYPAAFPANQVISEASVNKPGWNGGIGLNWKLGNSRASVFAEARYHHMFTAPRATTFVPVIFGFRW
jgi:opacity protein-like surface antigen